MNAIKRACFFFVVIVLILLAGCRVRVSGLPLPADPLEPAPADAASRQAGWPTEGWQTATPESQGIDGGKLEQMLEEIRTHALLDGVRGQPAVDKEAIIENLLRVGQLVKDFPEIVELDINPLIVYPEGQGAIAIDMRLVLSREPGTGENE